MAKHSHRFRARLRAWPAQHGHAAFSSLGRLWRGRGASLMSIGVAAIALALPLGLTVFVHNASKLTGISQGSVRISVFLKPGAGSQALARTRQSAGALPGVLSVHTITP